MAAELDLHWKSEWLRYMLAAASASSLVLPGGAEDDGRENAKSLMASPGEETDQRDSEVR